MPYQISDILSVEELLQPISSDRPCGDNLEYDPAFLEFERAAEVVPERQVGATIIPAQEPDWREVKTKALLLLERTKDLRVVMYLTVALVHEYGFQGLHAGLMLLSGLLARYWHSLHPQLDPEEGQDPTYRLNVLRTLSHKEAILTGLKNAPIVTSKKHGKASLRDLTGQGSGSLQMFASDGLDTEAAQVISESIAEALDYLSVIDSFLKQVINDTYTVDFTALEDVLRAAQDELAGYMPAKAISEGTVAPAPDSADRAEDLQFVDTEEPAVYYDQNVQFTVYRPRVVQPEVWYTLLAFAHLSERPVNASPDVPDPIVEVERQARQILSEHRSEYQGLVQDSVQPIPRESELTFVPEMSNIEFEPRQRSFRWQESVHRGDFQMRAKQRLDGKTCRGRLSVFLGSILVAEVILSIRVDSRCRGDRASIPNDAVQAKPYRKIFASYAHQDVVIVRQFERYARVLGDEFIRDLTHLRAGEVWSDRLGEMIHDADIFQLFWSWHAMNSDFVRKEWEQALDLDRPYFIRPVYWQEPFPERQELGLPPYKLRRLHFQRLPSVTNMQIRLSVTTYRNQPTSMPMGAIFGRDGGTIGRAEDCYWTLPDPECFLSKHHASIFFRDGAYYLTDTSTNGVYLNDALTPVGNGNSFQISNGDRLKFGDYEAAVIIAEGKAMGYVPVVEADHVPPLMESFQPPSTHIEQFPEDWDITHFGAASEPSDQETAEKAGSHGLSPLATYHAAPSSPLKAPSSATDTDAFMAFLKGAGLDLAEIEQGNILEDMEHYGSLFRLVVEGMMEVLHATTYIESEFKMPLTTIRRDENNPLKFSVSADEAIKHLLLYPGTAYLPPLESVRQAIEDIKTHQIALIAGMQAALSAMLQRFDPSVLELYFSLRGRRSLLQSKKAWYWEQYAEKYREILMDVENNFQRIFDQDFTRAYEETISRLKSSARQQRD